MNKAQHTTSCIVHLADSANFKGGTSNKRCSGLTGSCLEMPNDTIHVTVVFHTEISQPHKQHIWFLPKRKANTKKTKELFFANARRN